MNDIAEALRNTTEDGADPELIYRAADEIERLRNQVEIGQQVVNFGVGLMTKEQVGQWVGVRHFLEAGTEMYPPFADEDETPNAGGEATGAASCDRSPRP